MTRTLREKFGQLVSAPVHEPLEPTEKPFLPLASNSVATRKHDLRQAEAGIIYLKAILDGKEAQVAQVVVGAAFSANRP